VKWLWIEEIQKLASTVSMADGHPKMRLCGQVDTTVGKHLRRRARVIRFNFPDRDYIEASVDKKPKEVTSQGNGEIPETARPAILLTPGSVSHKGERYGILQ
jgi:hypothetical protein